MQRDKNSGRKKRTAYSSLWAVKRWRVKRKDKKRVVAVLREQRLLERIIHDLFLIISKSKSHAGAWLVPIVWKKQRRIIYIVTYIDWIFNCKMNALENNSGRFARQKKILGCVYYSITLREKCQEKTACWRRRNFLLFPRRYL